MYYQAKNVDTDKALKAINDYRKTKSAEHNKELYGVQKYYEGLNRGLDFAQNIFEFSNYEKGEISDNENT